MRENGVKPQPLARSKGTSVMLYGVPGVGKTYFIGTGEALIIRPPTDHTDSIPAGADTEEIIVSDWSKLLEVFQWGQQGGFSDYEWVWIDSLSLLQDHLLEDVMADAIARRPDRAVSKGGVMVPEYGPDQGEYKINFDRIVKVIRDLVGLADAGQFNFGVTAHPFEWWNPVLEENVWAPWIQGKNMSPKICGYMNIVAYLQENKRDGKPSQRVLLVDAPGFYGKDQVGLPEIKAGRHGIVEPTLPKLTTAIRTAKNGGKAKRRRTAKR